MHSLNSQFGQALRVKVIIRSNFMIEGLPENGLLEVKAPVTLREVLKELESRTKTGLVDRHSGEVDTQTFAIFLNGLEYQFLPQRLDTRLRDGDEVRVNVLQMAGG